MVSIFYIVLGNPKNVITTSDIFPQIDKMLPRENSIRNFWKDNTNQDSIWIEVFEGQDEIKQIGIRFDTSSPNEAFKNDIVDFASQNDFMLTIRQEVSFYPAKLNEEIINKNLKSWTIVENPGEYLENQKNYFH